MTKNPYREGQEAYQAGLMPDANPYGPSINLADRKEWLRGFKTALLNDPLLDKDERHEIMAKLKKS